MTTTNTHIVLLLRQAIEHDAQAQALRQEAGKLLAHTTPLQRIAIARDAGVSVGLLDLLAGSSR